MKKLFNSFIKHSSLPVSFMTLLYVGLAFRRSGRPSSVPYEKIAIMVPIMYGIFGSLNLYMMTTYGKNLSILIGAIFGLILSFLGRFMLDLPVKIFGFTKDNAYKVHLYAPFMYAFIFRFILPRLP